MKIIREHKRTLVLTSFLILLPTLAGLVLWEKLPDTIATHFGLDNAPDGWSSKPFAVLGIPLFLLALQWLGLLITARDPKKQNIAPRMLELVLWILPLCSNLLGVLCYGYALGWQPDVGRISSLFIGFLFLVIGNSLPKCRQSYTMGIKLPWTLNSEENWQRTHRLGGFLYCAAGLGTLVCTVPGWYIPIFVLLGAAILIPVLYSLLLHKRGI